MARSSLLHLVPLLLPSFAAGCGSSPGTPGSQDGGGRGLALSVAALAGGAPASFPVTSGGGLIDEGTLWIQSVALIGDQGSSDAASATNVVFDAPGTLEIALPDAPPGLYSLVRLDLAAIGGSTSGGGGGGGGDGQSALSSRAAGHLPSGRAFVVSDSQSWSIDLRAPTAMELLPNMQLRVAIGVDLSIWLQGIQFDGSGDSSPLLIGPSSDGGDVDQFRSNIGSSLSVTLLP